MCNKYEIISDGGRKRVRALRHFTVQGRDVCPMELGGYVYDANTLSQDGNCWIFSGSLEYPGVRVLDEAIVDMGNNLPKNNARPKATIIAGNSRIMGAISFETQSFEVAQTPASFEQGGYTSNAGAIPVKVADGARIRIPFRVFSGTLGSVSITSADYEARVTSLNEDGIVTETSEAWVTGGPAVTIPVTSPYSLVEVRKTAITAITPADVTAAGVAIRSSVASHIRIFNSSIVPVYNGSVANANYMFRFLVSGRPESPTTANIQNSYVRAECVFNNTNVLALNADLIKVNYNMVLTAGVYNYVSGVFRNTNINTPASVPGAIYMKRVLDVSDCPNFEYSPVTFPDMTAMIASGKTFYFKQCNMPVGSAIHYYDPKVNVWDNIDFTKAMADLGKPAITNTTLVSSNVQGMYRIRGNVSGDIGMLAQSASSFGVSSVTGLTDTYDSIIYKDCTITGIFTIIGRNVFGGTLGGSSKVTNTTGTAMVIDGSFRIEGNAQVTDTPLKGNGYIGDNAEIKNGRVEGYVYMGGNAKFTPNVVVDAPTLRRVIMRDNSKVLKQRDGGGVIHLEMYNDSVINAVITIASGGILVMRDKTMIERADTASAITIGGILVMRDNASIIGTVAATILGDVELIGKYRQTSRSYTITGKRVISDESQIAVVDLPPTKTTW